MSIIHYNLNDYNEILFGTYGHSTKDEETPMKYELPETVLKIISILAKKFGSNPVSKPISSVNEHRLRKQRHHSSHKSSDESWIISRDFKTTTIIEKKEGPDKIMNDIRAALNKISNKNYDTNKDIIVNNLNELISQLQIEKETNNDDKTIDATQELSKIANNIFDIASTNKFFSEIYAKLYKDISTQFPEVFNSILTTFLEGFTNTMRTIKYVDQRDNYDDFCKYNKGNDKRKATSIFITNLVKMDVIHADILMSIIKEIQNVLSDYMKQENRVNEVEEITENMFLLLTNDSAFLKTCIDSEIIENVKLISCLKPKEKPSISSRAIFKCLDIVDKCK